MKEGKENRNCFNVRNLFFIRFLVCFNIFTMNSFLCSVNNVGAMDYPQLFQEVPMERLWQLININIGAATLVRL